MPPPDENRTAMIVFTSGTTSEPCGAELTLAGVGAFASFAAGQLELGRGGRSLMLLPLFHIYGICAAYAMLASGVVLGICPDYRRLYDAVVRFKADFLFLVPALADILAAKFEQRIKTTPHSPGTTLKWICSGGAPLSPRTHGRLQALGLEVFSAYGLTETTALYSISRAGGDSPLGSAGAACTLPGVETRVSPEGELMIRGPNVLKGYYGDKERTRKSKTADGWFHTGDLGRIDENGTVWVTGRKTRTIVLSSGKKVAPEEIEAKILLYPGMREAIVRGDGGSRELSAEIYADLLPEEAHEAVAAMNRTLPIYMRVRKVYIRDTPFPRTASGKILLARPPVPAKRMRPVKKLMIASGVLALTVFVLDMLPYAWYHGNPDSSPLVKRLFRINEITGELLLAAFAVTLLVTGWRLKDIFGDRVSRRRRRKK
jgi:long-chain acyl-CoA synthetase